MVIIWSQRILLKNRALIGTESILEDFAMTLTSDFEITVSSLHILDPTSTLWA